MRIDTFAGDLTLLVAQLKEPPLCAKLYQNHVDIKWLDDHLSQVMLNWLTATNIRLRLMQTKTMLGHLMSVAQVTKESKKAEFIFWQ